jgi:hypothetical protein
VHFVPRTEASADAGELPRAAPGVLYAIGAGLGDTVQPYQLDEDEVREVARGMAMRRSASPPLRSARKRSRRR